jgi:hypothetical protein
VGIGSIFALPVVSAHDGWTTPIKIRAPITNRACLFIVKRPFLLVSFLFISFSLFFVLPLPKNACPLKSLFQPLFAPSAYLTPTGSKVAEKDCWHKKSPFPLLINGNKPSKSKRLLVFCSFYLSVYYALQLPKVRLRRQQNNNSLAEQISPLFLRGTRPLLKMAG